MTLDEAGPGDLPAIVAITNHAILHTTALWNVTPATLATRSAFVAERQAQGFPVLVLRQDDEVVGFGSFGQFRPHEGYRQTVEHSLYLRADRQGQGLGGVLLQALVERATALGMHTMVAGIEAENGPSLTLHRRHGFAEVGRLPEVGRKFDRWLTLVLMQRLLRVAAP